MKYIIHIMPNNNYTDRLKKVFNAFQNTKNEYIVLTHFYNKRSNHNAENLIIKYSNKFWQYRNILQILKPDIIILHKYTISGCILVQKMHKSSVILVNFYGGENQSMTKETVLYNQSKKIVTYCILKGLFTKRFYLSIFFIFFLPLYIFILKKTIRHFQYLSTVFPFEYTNLINHIQFTKQTHYIPIKLRMYQYKPIQSKEIITGNDIIVGNSANFANHKEIFDILKKTDLKERKIIVPLSYGGIPSYTQYINKIGHKYFKNNFITIKAYMPLDQYYDTLRTANVFINPHLVQRAMGNVFQSLIEGRTIYFFKESSAYVFLKDVGFIIFNIEDDVIKSKNEFNHLLSETMINQNRKLVEKMYSQEISFKNISKLINFSNKN